MSIQLAAFLSFVVGALLGALLTWLWQRGRWLRLLERLRWQSEGLERAQAAGDEAERLRLELARREAESEADLRRLDWMQDAHEELRTAFQAFAAQALQQSTQELVQRSRQQLDALLDALRSEWTGQREGIRHLLQPVGESLADLGGQIRQLEKERQGAYEGLRKEVGLLRDAHRDLQSTTAGLRQALRSPTVRGRWGEVQLRRVVEMAGLAEHVDFVEQPDVDGLRPDMIVHLPHKGTLPVDAKAPLDAYLDAAEAPDEAARRSCLDAHCRALRKRIVELGQRRYWERLPGAPDFVVMFVPSEAALSSAFERDPRLLDVALRDRVLPASPITLLALLKSVAFGWQQQRVAEGAQRMAELGRDLHKRLVHFVGHLRRLGRGLDSSLQSYNQAVGSLERRVLPAVRRLEEAGGSAEEIQGAESIGRQPRQPQDVNEAPPEGDP